MLTLLAVATIVALAYAANAYRIDLANARHRARHLERLRLIAEERAAAARQERDEALDFADEATLLLAVQRHPVSGPSLADVTRRLEVVK